MVRPCCLLQVTSDYRVYGKVDVTWCDTICCIDSEGMSNLARNHRRMGRLWNKHVLVVDFPIFVKFTHACVQTDFDTC